MYSFTPAEMAKNYSPPNQNGNVLHLLCLRMQRTEGLQKRLLGQFEELYDIGKNSPVI